MWKPLALVLILPLSGCLAASVAGAAISVTSAVVVTGVKTTGAIIGAAIPDGDDDDDGDERDE